MQRQKSILSFFQKPLHPSSQNSTSSCHVPANQQLKHGVVQSQPAGSDGGLVRDPSVEVRGTDTPPEKVPRQVLPAGFAAVKEDTGGGGSSLFSSIMHKFVRVENAEKPLDKNQANSTFSNACFKVKELPPEQGIAPPVPEKDNAFCFKSEDDVPKPETPGMQPLFPRLKRIREDSLKFEDKYGCNTQSDASKKGKFVKDITADLGKVSNVGISDGSASKFEWLDPSRIKDANGRRPNDPLYDRKTLYIPPDALKKMSASQKQYWTVKSQYMDVVLFFKVGKFYELYELDAEIGHRELDWKITLSGVGKCRQVGISESGIDDAVEKLVARGYKVGRIEQLETSDQAKARGGSSVIPRKLVQVVTPATVTDGNIGPDAVNLLAIKEEAHGLDIDGKTVYGFAFVDCAALQFWVGSINDDASSAALGALLMQVSPKEVIYESRGLSKEAQKALRKYSGTGTTALEASATNFVNASEIRSLIQLKGYFSGSSNPWNDALDGVIHHDACLCALGGLVSHLSRMMSDDVLRNGNVLPYQVHKGCLRMDGQTLVNLEVFSNNADGGASGTLLSYLDNCMTSSGKRLLRKWICHPLKCIEGINNRLNVVEFLIAHGEIISVTAQYLRKIPDLERMLGRVKASCQASAPILLPFIGKKTLRQRVKVFGSLVKGLRIAMDMLLLLEKEEQMHSLLLQIFSLPDLNGSDGLDKFLIQFEAAVASEFPNYQNHDVTDSEAETLSVLIELFIEKASQWLQVIHGVNCIDVLRSFAVIASMSSGVMSRPVILPQLKTTTFSQKNNGPVLNIKGLWHPFALGVNGELPVPNDLYLGDDSDESHPLTLLLTGPNMGGKSTLLRAACLAVLLAQLGCFVPSQKCVLSIVDIIFTRLGATDRIMTGESTFFVECTETASVLQNATQDSLVILDELGRGTSTFDGYAIAYAVFRHLVEKVNCRLLFATHYHPLTKEFASHPHVKLQHMACAFKPRSESYSEGVQDLVFLYRLTSGACPESYGLQVATMAGVPEKVVEAASQAAKVMKKSVGQSFKSSEQRSEFSTLHEDWLKNLVNVARTGVDTCDDDNDLYDTLFCLWHELKSSYRLS